jgi:hypothetical protein
MSSVLNSLSEMLTPQVTAQLAKTLDMDPQQFAGQVNVAAPLLLKALERESDKAPDEVLGLLKQEDTGTPAGMLNAIHTGAGETMVDTLFGSGANKVVATMHDATSSDLGPILPVVAPLVFGLLTKTVKAQKLDGTGLQKLLQSENAEFAASNSLLSQQIRAALDASDQAATNAEHNRARFTTEEWDALTKVPLLASFAVMMSALNGPIGVTKEIMALGEAMSTTAHVAPGDSLVGLVSHSFKNPEQLNQLGAHHENAARLAVEACTLALQALGEKASPQEAYEYKQFVLYTARNVAQAAREGGLFGLGGIAVNDKEQAMLDEIALALDFKP